MFCGEPTVNNNTDEKTWIERSTIDILVYSDCVINHHTFLIIWTIDCPFCENFCPSKEVPLPSDSFEGRENSSQEKINNSAEKRNFLEHKPFELTKDSSQCNKVLQIGKKEKSLKKLNQSYWKDFDSS